MRQRLYYVRVDPWFLLSEDAALKPGDMPQKKIVGYAVAQLVTALSYKPRGHGFDSRCGH